jgi:hypothetical protein
MTQSAPPDRATFLDATDAEVAAIAPATAVYALGGTRRRAAMEGIPLDETYIDHSRPQMVDNIAIFFRHGIRHLIVPCLGPRQLAEVAPYGERIIDWSIRALAGPEMLEDYRRLGWRARMIVTSPIPALHAAAERLRQEPSDPRFPTIWYYFVADDTDPWAELFAAVQRTGARTYAEALRAVYGEEVPPATLFVGFGKPVTGTTLVPPLLCAPNMQCYWMQRAGLRLTDRMLRDILYDYAYTRQTWRADRRFRYEQSAEQQTVWETTQILGVGSAKNGFWYPEPFGGSQE